MCFHRLMSLQHWKISSTITGADTLKVQTSKWVVYRSKSCAYISVSRIMNLGAPYRRHAPAAFAMFAIFAELWVRKHPAAESSCPYRLHQWATDKVYDAAPISSKSGEGEDDRGRSSSKRPSHSRESSTKKEGERSPSPAKFVHDGSASPDTKSIHDESSHSGDDLVKPKPVGGDQKWLVLNKHAKSSHFSNTVDETSVRSKQRKFRKGCRLLWPSGSSWGKLTSSSN